MDCIFCKIAAGEIPCNKVYEDDLVLAFHDIAPQAPIHVVVIPKTHELEGVRSVTAENAQVVGAIFTKIPHIAHLAGADNGYRVVTNNGEQAGQTVQHLHFHVLGGKILGEMC